MITVVATALAAGVVAVALSVVVRTALEGRHEASLPTGVYHGWLAGGDARFQLAGAPCSADDPLQSLELSGPGAGALRLAGEQAAREDAEHDRGRAVTVTTLSAAALAPLVPQASGEPAPVTFTRARARCRSWREVDADIGHARVEILDPAARFTGDQVGMHVLPVPDRTGVLAVLLLWNRSAERLMVTSLDYAPPAVSTGMVLAVAGGFEEYGAWEAALFPRPGERAAAGPTSSYQQRPAPGAPRPDPEAAMMTATATSSTPTAMDAAQLELDLAPGRIALIALDRASFTNLGGASVLLSYPVVRLSLGGRELVLGVEEPLYSPRLRLGGRPTWRAVLHSLFAASPPVGPAASEQ